jgi:hypothetical protein
MNLTHCKIQENEKAIVILALIVGFTTSNIFAEIVTVTNDRPVEQLQAKRIMISVTIRFDNKFSVSAAMSFNYHRLDRVN